MQHLRVALVLSTIIFATTAVAQCNPPPPGLDFNQWTGLCQNEIAYAYNTMGGGMDVNQFVSGLYMMYVDASMGGGTAMGPAATGACSPDGSSYCNTSGWLLTCTGGQWLTGATQC